MADEETLRLHGLGHDPSTRELLGYIRKLEARVEKLENQSIFLESPLRRCKCGWSGNLTECEIHSASAGGLAWIDFLCPLCRQLLNREYE